MQKLVVVVALLVLGGGGYYLYTQVKTTNPSSAEVAKETPAAQKFSLKSLLGFSGSQTCTFANADGATSGTVYVDSGKMRGDFQTQMEDKVTSSHVISDGTTLHMWMDGQTQGFKYTLESFEDLAESADTSKTAATTAVDLNAESDYTCRAGSIASDKFVLPANVTFSDYSDMLKDVQGSSSTCAACASLTGEAQEQCQTVLKCK